MSALQTAVIYSQAGTGDANCELILLSDGFEPMKQTRTYNSKCVGNLTLCERILCSLYLFIYSRLHSLHRPGPNFMGSV